MNINLEEANQELATKEGAYVWNDRLRSGIGTDIDANKRAALKKYMHNSD